MTLSGGPGVKYAGSASGRAAAVWEPFGTLGTENRPPAVVEAETPPTATPTLGRRTVSAGSAIPLAFSS